VVLEFLSKQILFLIDTEAHYSVLPAFAGKPSSHTVIIVGVDEKNQIRNFLAIFKLSFLCIDFL
jgi:hypothetical protein